MRSRLIFCRVKWAAWFMRADARNAGEAQISAMISLETNRVFFRCAATHKHTPRRVSALFYPKVGNFIGFVRQARGHGALLRRVIAAVPGTRKDSEPRAPRCRPSSPACAGRIDLAPSGNRGYPAIMVTDTAPFRYPYYHSSNDTPDKLEYDRFTLVVSGMEKVIKDLDNRSRNRRIAFDCK